MIPESDLEDLVSNSIEKIRLDEEDEIRQFQSLGSLREAISIAAKGTDVAGKHFSHQNRILKSADGPAVDDLLSAADEIAACKSFDQLLELVEAVLRNVHGAGELHAYDTSFRIGARLGLLPEKVYLHAGTRKGAVAIGFSGKERFIDMQQFPLPLREFKPWELESFLCIASSELGRLAASHA